VGTYHARFKHFVKTPITTAQYALSLVNKTDKHYLGHNPLGAVMVVFLLTAIFIQAGTGLFTNDEIFNAGPLYAYISDELSLQLTSLHRQLFYWILAGVALHILAVILHVRLKRDNIIKAMFTGNKNLPASETSTDHVAISASKICLAVVLVIALSAILAAVILTAPEAITDMEY
jgi:cytochrome b